MIGLRIKKIRKEKGLSQKAFAEILNTSSGYISEVEQGKIIPGGKFFISLKQVININLNWLVTGEGAPYLSDDDINIKSKEEILKATINFLKQVIVQDNIKINLDITTIEKS